MTNYPAWLDQAFERVEKMPPENKELRERAEKDLWVFAQLVNPQYMYGDIHRECYRFLGNYSLFSPEAEEEGNNKLLMLPRGHLKSHMLATSTVWLITNHPEIAVIYLSATSELTIYQMYAIQMIMESDQYQRYWPEYIHPERNHRKKWTESKMIIDHPAVGQERSRDPTINCAGLTTNTTGWHCDVLVADDLVVPENAYTIEGRNSVRRKSSQFTSIRNPGSFTMAAGTRYHPADIFATWKDQSYSIYDDNGMFVEDRPVWEIKEKVVEIDGRFIWPRTIRSDNKAFGFNQNILSRIYAEYDDKEQFYAQYYNDPNRLGSSRISPDHFQYYDQRHIKREEGDFYYKDRKLNVYAAIDFAYSLNGRADYTAIVVIGIDWEGCIYILDIARFKSNMTKEYFEEIIQMHQKWEFKKIRAEVTAAQDVIVNDIKDYIKKSNRRIVVEKNRPDKNKEERISSILDYRYENNMMWHYQGGFTPVLEEELVASKPPHDDVKDVLSAAVEMAVKPQPPRGEGKRRGNRLQMNSRFGGVAFRERR